MSIELTAVKQNLIPPEIKNQLEQLAFTLSTAPENGVMWGFDGKTEYFPREIYIREENDRKLKIKLKIEKTTNGFNLVINSIPFKKQNHLNRWRVFRIQLPR